LTQIKRIKTGVQESLLFEGACPATDGRIKAGRTFLVKEKGEGNLTTGEKNQVSSSQLGIRFNYKKLSFDPSRAGQAKLRKTIFLNTWDKITNNQFSVPSRRKLVFPDY